MHKVNILLMSIIYACGLHAANADRAVLQEVSKSSFSSLPPLPSSYLYSLHAKGKTKEALEHAEKILKHPKSVLSDRAASLMFMGDIYSEGTADVEKNLPLALEKYRAIFSLGHPDDLSITLTPRYIWALNQKITKTLNAQEQLLQAAHEPIALPPLSTSSSRPSLSGSARQLLKQGDKYLEGTISVAQNLQKALEYYTKVLKAHDKTDQDALKAYAGIADIYLIGENGVTTDHAKALEYYEKALELAKKLNNYEETAIILASIGGLHFIGGAGISKDYLEAIKSYNEALQNAHLLPKETLARIYFYLGDIYKKGQNGSLEPDLQLALNYYNMAEQYKLTLEDAAKIAQNKLVIYELLNNEKDALTEAHKYKDTLNNYLKNFLLYNPQLTEKIAKIQNKLKEINKKITSLQPQRKRTVRLSDRAPRLQRIDNRRQRTTRSNPEPLESSLLFDTEIFKTIEQPSSSPSSTRKRNPRVILDDEPIEYLNQSTGLSQDAHATSPEPWLQWTDSSGEEEEELSQPWLSSNADKAPTTPPQSFMQLLDDTNETPANSQQPWQKLLDDLGDED